MSGGLFVRHYTRRNPVFAGLRLFFVSDIHLQNRRIVSLFPFLRWQSTELMDRNLNEALRKCSPDLFLFGGDLVTETVCLEEAFHIFRRIPDSIRKFAVPGNWDLRYPWLTPDYWAESYAEAGVTMLRNAGCLWNNLFFYGADDFKEGNPEFPESFPEGGTVLLAHNPDTLRKAPEKLFTENTFILTGHTHGGQIRIPVYGAVKTSTIEHKYLEYGPYRHSSGAGLVVTSGIGTTWLPVRLFCPPEAVCITFTE